MDTDKIKVFGARVKVDSTAGVAEIERAEREKMKAKVEKIKNHGINVFINRQLIYNYPEQVRSLGRTCQRARSQFVDRVLVRIYVALMVVALCGCRHRHH